MDVYLVVILAILGLVFGSFAGASVWRLRARQLVADMTRLKELKARKKHDLSVDEQAELTELTTTKGEAAKELKVLEPLTKRSVRHDHSECLHCHHRLAWYDLIPLASWLSTKGRCRYCKAPIGWFEPAIELATAGLFVTMYYYWVNTAGNDSPGMLLLWLAIALGIVILFFYDLKWLLLPNAVMWSVIMLSTALCVWTALSGPIDAVTYLADAAWSVLVLAGLYLALWLASRGRWVGFGDVKLGLALGLLLADWRLAFLTVFLANFIGTLLVLPGLITKKIDRTSQIPFGPLLIVGFFVSLLFGQYIIDWYVNLLGSTI
jgi:prepilin signal peptidase PulO-like enzyme (type II secretory pathway)